MGIQEVNQFASLFAGRRDVWFSSIPSPRLVKGILTIEHFRQHLRGEIEIGTYPVRDDSSCRWSCIDIDDGNDDRAFNAALDLHAVWSFYGAAPFIERSRSKGYHVWVFVDRWLSAKTVRSAGLWVNDISEVNSKEVNPKNDAPWLTSKGIINTVRTPYSGAAKKGRMIVVDTDGSEIPFEDFVRLASHRRTRANVIRALSERWQGQQRKAATQAAYEARRGLAQFDVRSVAVGERDQSAKHILRGQRTAVHGERDNQFFTIARYLLAAGTPKELALRMIESTWREQVPDKNDFTLDAALSKVHRVYSS